MLKEFLRPAVVCFAAALAAGGGAQTPEPTVLRLITYNIHHAEGRDKVLDLDRIVAVIKAASPDIVCLQEVDRNLPRTQHLDFPALLAEKLGMSVTFSANYLFDGGEYGNATLSHLPLKTWRNISLPGPKGAEPRGCLETVYEWQGKPVRVWNTHLGLRGPEREDQMRHILEAGFAADVVFCGDMNENTAGKGLQQLMALLDADQAKHLCDDPTFPAGKPGMRIDHVFTGSDYSVLRCEVIRNKTTAVASDHLPIVAEIAMK